jgi:hypothetical protein
MIYIRYKSPISGKLLYLANPVALELQDNPVYSISEDIFGTRYLTLQCRVTSILATHSVSSFT